MLLLTKTNSRKASNKHLPKIFCCYWYGCWGRHELQIFTKVDRWDEYLQKVINEKIFTRGDQSKHIYKRWSLRKYLQKVINKKYLQNVINEKIFTKGDQWDNSLEFHRVGDAVPTSPGEWQSQSHHHYQWTYPCVTWNLNKIYWLSRKGSPRAKSPVQR